MNSRRKCRRAVSEAWTPDLKRLDYVQRIIEALCALWAPDKMPAETKAVLALAEHKLSALWTFEYAHLPVGHKMLCNRVYWDALVTRFPSNLCQEVVAYYTGINPDSKPRNVVLRVQPSKYAEIISLCINSDR